MNVSIENNKQDFEEALKCLSELVEDLDKVLQHDIMQVIETVIGEYDGHLQGDIETMIYENRDMKDKLDN